MSGRNWTPAQKNAIEAETGTLLVSAAAGSGKTSVLVERIVRKLTRFPSPVSPSSLLVVTFTNAAAAEMRSKIYTRISELMHSSVGGKSAFSSLLSHLDEMNVCTMDSFCIKLVREYFHACGVSSDFTMLDGGENKILKAQTAADVVEDIFAEYPEKASSLAKLFQHGRTDDKLIEAIIDLSDFSMSEPEPDKWLDGVTALYNETPPDRSEWGKIISDEVYEGIKEMTRLASVCLYELETCPVIYEYKNVKAIFHSLYDACERAGELFPALSWDEKRSLIENTADAVNDEMKFIAPKGYANDPVKVACASRREMIKKYFRETAPNLMCASEEEHLEDVRRLKPDAELLILAVKRFNKELLDRKREQNAYDFSDILHFALKLLYDPSAPDGKTESARELTERFSEILIDEYQDTNRAQDMLFSCLSKNGGNLFTVGDVKQSIYRFRLASPEIFIEKSDSFPPFDGKAERSKIVLSNNFRSRKGILASVNYMFGAVMSKQCGEIEYGEDERLFPPPETENEPTGTDFAMHFVVDGSGIADEAEYMAKLIKKTVLAGTEVHTGGAVRKAEYGDFCILLRSAKNNSSVISSILRKHGIPVSIEAKDGFFSSAEIRLAMSLLHVVDNPSADVHLLAVMLSPLFGFTPDDAAKIRLDTANEVPDRTGLWGRAVYLADRGNPLCRELKNTVVELRRDISVKTAGQAVRTVFERTGIISVMGASSDGELRRSNLRRIISMAETYSVDPSRTLGAFIRYLDALCEGGANVKRAGGFGTGSVRIMTMHSSKGLEFPFVLIAGIQKRFNDRELSEVLVTEHTLGVGLKVREPSQLKSYSTLSSTAVSLLKKRASRSEELRILYVAMTRAKEKLFIISSGDIAKSTADINAVSPLAKPVSPYVVNQSASFYKWFILAFMHHPDAYCLRNDEVEIIPADFPAEFLLVTSEKTEEEQPSDEKSAEADEALTREICERMTLNYRYAAISSSLAKHTASTLHAERFSPEFFGDRLPSFLGKNGVSAADIGTATHRFLQYCDFDAAKTDIEAEKARLTAAGRITEEQAGCLDGEAVRDFVSGTLADEIRNADTVYREKRFTVAESVCDIEHGVSEEFRDEKTVVIGKIDLCFIKNGEAVIIDYKTDAVTDENVLVNRYREQLKLYSSAAERILGCVVSRCILYSLKGRKAIEVPKELLN